MAAREAHVSKLAERSTEFSENSCAKRQSVGKAGLPSPTAMHLARSSPDSSGLVSLRTVHFSRPQQKLDY